ncbi:hypothetical protein CAL29_20770 [Bordetella genomosp. 10]|uniref:HTH araC/xylS-type domain-containing protein n=1 Tax=Bordetella genomosp. 10 TaxID=1416804 RepID=A0A261S0M3_9BORD|nr:AraC family transcriptional regulator [Bordetella genomosp. 10]OZI30462.1 hypothetical protein CAL29_20770 [Bordetella genomosp. 10]
MPSPSTSSRAPCSEDRLGAIARAWGYGASVQLQRPAGATPKAPVLARGTIEAQQLASGIRLCRSDLRGACDQVRTADLPRSLTAFVMLDGAQLRWRHGAAARPRDGMAQAGVLAVHEHANLIETQRRGERSRTFVVQAVPDEILDDVLADQLQAALRRTQALPLDAGRGFGSASAAALSMDDAGGAISALLRESAALALLARAFQLIEAGAGPGGETQAVHPRDRQRMLHVRDLLMAQPEAAHTLGALAREAGVSVTTLKLRFPQVIGCSVFEFLRARRLDRARHGLLHEGWSVKQAAYYAGYRHPTNFATAFRRKFGAAPSQA